MVYFSFPAIPAAFSHKMEMIVRALC